MVSRGQPRESLPHACFIFYIWLHLYHLGGGSEMQRLPPFLSHGVAEGVGVNVFSTPVGESIL